MAGVSNLDRLAELAGIDPGYWDIWGNRHAVTDDVKRAMLRAMGLSIDGPESIAAACTELEEAPWRRMLPPVAVFHAGVQPWTMPVVLPAGSASPVAWRIDLESGRHVEWRASLKQMPVVERSTLGGEALERRTVALPEVEPGYHRIQLVGYGETAPLIVAPERCHMPAPLDDGGRTWGLAVQLFSLRSPRNWGMGDFTDLRALVDAAADLGAGAINLNPLHALFPWEPTQASPYGPSSRHFCNVLYIDVEAVPDFAECSDARAMVQAPEFQKALQGLRATTLVDYAEVGRRKMEALELLYASFRRRHLDGGRANDPRAESFRRFQARGGVVLQRFAQFEVLAEHFRQADPPLGSWRQWPAPFQDPESDEVEAFCAERVERVGLSQYLQWEAERQLLTARERAGARGLAIGLCQDLALGSAEHGADAWAALGLARGVSLGAPPDAFSLQGQKWGLPPPSPIHMRETAYAELVSMLRSNMESAGALRVDHILGLMRLFWIPDDVGPVDGAYVGYELDELLGIIALESYRNRCMVIGEDLGTVPDGLRDKLRRSGVLGYKVLYFERGPDGGFIIPEHYGDLALVTVGTHDLPTLPGFWSGHDLDVRAGLSLFPDAEAEAQERRARADTVRRLLHALAHQGLVPWETASADPLPELTPALVEAVYRYLARTPGKLLLVQLEDVLDQKDQVNLPGTVDEHPNWRRKLSIDVSEIASEPRVKAIVEILAEEGR